jgi:PAS domain S-box-containing protein
MKILLYPATDSSNDMSEESRVITVLVVDDDPECLEIAELFLKQERDIRVVKAQSVNEAFICIDREPVDVIICDYEMPGANGIDLLTTLRNSGHRTPFMILTGKGWEKVAMKAINQGADYYLTKDSNPKALYDEIRLKIRQMVLDHDQERLIREQSLKYRKFFEGSPIAFILVDRFTGKIVDANKAACRLFGYTRDELIGLASGCVFEVCCINQASPGGEISSYTFTCPLQKDGTRFPAEIMIWEFPSGSRPYFGLIVQDQKDLR